MGDIDLFYEIKNLFNTSERAFDIYNILKFITQKSDNNKILYIVLNLKARDEVIQKYEMFTDFKRINENTLQSKRHKEKTIEIRTIENISKKKFLYGRRYKEIRFYQ